MKLDDPYLILTERGFLATVSNDGAPTVVPVCFVAKGNIIYSAIDRKPKQGGELARVSNISSNSQVALIIDRYGSDWRRLSYTLLHGVARMVTGHEEAAQVRSLLVKKYPQYRWLGIDDVRIIAVKVTKKKFWQFSKSNQS